MPLPLRWFRNPRRLNDATLVSQLSDLLLQLSNELHLGDPHARTFLEAQLLAHLAEVENRIAQGRLFD